MKKFLIFLLMIVLGACGDDSTKKVNEMTQDKRIDLLESEVISLENQVNQLGQSSVSFTPGSTGYYSTVHTDMGNLIISLEDLKKYANGYKVTFLIGNPNYTTFDDVKLLVHWGQAYSYQESYADWYKALQSKEIEINKSMLPGVWNKVIVVLSPATANEVGTIIVSLESNSVSFTRDLRRDSN